MKVLVTGGGGFIGSHVVAALLQDGHDVRALVRYTSTGNWGHLESHRRTRDVEVVLGDVRDADSVDRAVSGRDAVLHLAALIGIPYSYEAPSSYVETNIAGTLHVLEATRRHGVRRLVITSTSEVYGTAVETPMTERHPLHAQSPYAATKVAADQLALSYHRSFDIPVVVLRPFNTYGPRQSARAVIPAILTQLVAGAEALHLGSLRPRRDLTFVTDTAEAFVRAMSAPDIEGETIHFGSGAAIAIGELAERCMRITGRHVPVLTAEDRVRPLKSEVEVLLADASKAARLLNWTPSVGLDEGIDRTLGHVRRHLDRYDVESYAT